MSDVPGSVGQVIAKRYRLVSLLGQGGMGCVWRAEHVSLKTPLAIKLIHADVATRPGAVQRFLREARAAAMLRSANVVQILDHGVDDGAPYIAMECLEGESLATRLRREGKLDTAGTALIMSGVCRALARAHQMGIIHRDLKPDNIFIAQEETGPVVKVLDFGIAKMIGPQAPDNETANRTETGAMLGTPRFMSPEQARGKTDLDARSDLWSLAVIAFQCLVGKPPFDAETLGDLILQVCSDPIPVPSSLAEVPPGFDAWFARATQRRLEDRFQTAEELADALSEVLSPDRRWLGASTVPTLLHVEAPGESVAPSIDRTAGPEPRRPASRRTYALVAGAVVAAVVAIVAFTRPSSPIESSPPELAATAPEAVPPTQATTPIPTSASSSTSKPASDETLRVKLGILPSDASVELDGVAAPSQGGTVELVGKLGSVHRVRVFKGKLETSTEVSITDHGPKPAKVELATPRTKTEPVPARVDNFDE